MKKVLKNKNYIIIAIFIILFELFLYVQMNYTEPNMTFKYNLVFIVCSTLVDLALLLILYSIKNNKILKIENLFLLVAGLFGSIYLIFIPALLGTDELPHFLRPYQISVGDVIVKNPSKNETKIPISLATFVGEKKMIGRYSKKYIEKKVNYDETTQLWNGDVTSINYSPIPYLPQIIGFWISKLFGASTLITMYIVRLCNFISWLILSYFAFKILPVKKTFAYILYTSAAVLSLVSTCSGDAFALGLFLYFIAYILSLINLKRKFGKKDFLIFILIAIGFSTYKIFYVLYVLLLFMIPKESFNNSKKKKFFILSSIVISTFALDFIWFILSAVSNIGEELVSKQIAFILNNPLKYLFVFLNTYIKNFNYYIVNFTSGSEMCYGLIRLNNLLIYIYTFVFIVSYFNDNDSVKISKWSKFLVIFVCGLIFVFVSTTLYLSWTSAKLGIGANEIVGIQSRYFWPL